MQLHPDPGFHQRLAAQTYRFLKQLPKAQPVALLNRRCGPLSEPPTAQLQALPLEKLEAL
ncbi:MAG: hypothetical protein HQ469_02260, partial [Cyanobacteria bacterium]|nr:hypothetical protein [Cyanobacteria bacterium bin.275]